MCNHNDFHLPAISADYLNLRLSGLAGSALVLVEGPDGDLAALAALEVGLVQAVERGGHLVWVSAELAAASSGEQTVGGPVPAMTLRRQASLPVDPQWAP